MTEKLFKMGISRTKKTGIILERELSTDEVFNELVYCVNKNKHLKNENEQLKNKLKFFNELNKPYGDIIRENEQLKQSFINLIDKKIEEFKNGDYGDLPCNTIHMFLDLKEELKGDVE